MLDTWLERWRDGRTGWHETEGNALLKRHWPRLVRGSRVLVPLCGKSVDLLWLVSQGLDVSGVEISEIAVRAFFDDNDLDYVVTTDCALPCYAAKTVPVKIYCGDYFEFDAPPFDALYDRGALVAMPPEDRPRYVQKTTDLLKVDGFRLIIILTYDQDKTAGPPFSVTADELHGYWADLDCAKSHNDLPNAPPKFRDAGLDEVIESVWVST